MRAGCFVGVSRLGHTSRTGLPLVGMKAPFALGYPQIYNLISLIVNLKLLAGSEVQS